MTGKLGPQGIAVLLVSHGRQHVADYVDMIENAQGSNAQTEIQKFFGNDWIVNSGSLRIAGTGNYQHLTGRGMPARLKTLAENLKEEKYKTINSSSHKLDLLRTIVMARSGVPFIKSYDRAYTRKIVPLVVTAMTLEYLSRHGAIQKLKSIQAKPTPYDLETMLKLAATCPYNESTIRKYGMGRLADGTDAWSVKYEEKTPTGEILYAVDHEGTVRLMKDITLPETTSASMIGQKVSKIVGNSYWDMLGIKITTVGRDKNGLYLKTDANRPKNLYVLGNFPEDSAMAA